MNTNLEIEEGLRPAKVAKLFGVHLRTIFRWVKYGFLKSESGRVRRDEVESALPLWRNSVSLREARKRLQISTGTSRSWREKGILRSVTVMGEERVTILSVDSAPQKRETGPIEGDHKTVWCISVYLGVNTSTTKKFCGTDIRSVTVGNRVIIPSDEAERIKYIADNSCSIPKAAWIMGITTDVLRRMIANKTISTFTFLGKRLVDFASMGNNIEIKKRQMTYRKALEKKRERRRVIAVTNEKKRKEKIKRVASLLRISGKGSEASISCIHRKNIPIPITRYGFGKPHKVTTVFYASRAIGISQEEICNLMDQGLIRYLHDGEKFPYFVSVMAWMRTQTKTEIKVKSSKRR